MNKIVFKGTCTAMITPFEEDGIDFTSLRKQIEFQIANGIDALCFLGTTGEASTINDTEYDYVAKFARDTINKRVKFILGTGSNCTKTCIEKSKKAEKIGADAILVVTPYYNKCTQKGIVKYYKDVSESVETPIICYNVPSRTGVNILPETMAEIAEIGSISGIKESIIDIKQLEFTARLIQNKTALYSGEDYLNYCMLTLGSYGSISAVSNIIPKTFGDIAKNYFEGKTVKALYIQDSIKELLDEVYSEVNPISIKKAIELMGLGLSTVRPPLTELENSKILSLKKSLKNYGLIQ